MPKGKHKVLTDGASLPWKVRPLWVRLYGPDAVKNLDAVGDRHDGRRFLEVARLQAWWQFAKDCFSKRFKIPFTMALQATFFLLIYELMPKMLRKKIRSKVNQKQIIKEVDLT